MAAVRVQEALENFTNPKKIKIVGRIPYLICLLCLGFGMRAQRVEKPYVLLISMDGFRWDYPDRYPTPELDKLAAEGVKAKALRPAFPTKTFPNHYTIATGLYPDHHGIIANHFYNPTLKAFFSIRSDSKYDPRFYGGQPIWNVLKRNHIRTASYFWPGSDVPINGMQPDIWKRYDAKATFSQRIDSVAAWFDLPEAQRPHFVTLYFEQPDLDGHHHGPMSAAVGRRVTRMDSLLGVLRAKLARTKAGGKIDIILLSDHGMAATSTARLVNLSGFPRRWASLKVMGSPLLFVKAKPGAYEKLKAYLKRIPHTQLFFKGHAPRRLHYGSNPNELDFTLVADLGWTLTMAKNPRSPNAGNHGYDNRNKEMDAIFYAVGPDFKQHYRMARFENVNVFPLILKIFHLKGPKVDGSTKLVGRMLRP